jgi:Amt family ammonium transporter
VDDPVGAISVHGVCGAWGTLAVGIFNEAGFTLHGLGVQALGVAACFVWTFVTAYILFRVIKAVIGLRVTEEEEKEGLDFGEHGGNAYPDFQVHPACFR